MRPPDRRELAWLVTNNPDGDGFTVIPFDSEAELISSVSRRLREYSSDPNSGDRRTSDPTLLPFATGMVSADEAMRHGHELWTSLPPACTGPLSVANEDQPLVVKVVTSGSSFARLPWEWLADDEGRHVALRPGLRLVRTIPARLPIPPISVSLPLRILVVGAIRGDESGLDPGAEIKHVMAGLGDSRFQLEVLERASRSTLEDAIARHPPHVLHHVGFAAQIHGEGNLALVARDGATEWMTASELAGTLPPSTRLICLSTPSGLDAYRSLGSARIAESPSVIGLPTSLINRYPVTPEEAATFWSAFYPALIDEGGDVIEASHVARLATAERHPWSAGWASVTPVIRDQSGIAFDLGRSEHLSPGRRKKELAAQFAAKITNDLATQISVFGDSAPPALRDQFEFEHKRASDLSSALDDEAG